MLSGCLKAVVVHYGHFQAAGNLDAMGLDGLV